MSKEQEISLFSGLFIVPTPIGNLEDITQRAINVLKKTDIIACEDTRHTGLLLKNLGIVPKKLVSYHEHNEINRSAELTEEMLNGKTVSLLSDAGTPCISDPGYRIVKSAIEKGIKITPLPGATAFIPALTASGFAINSFLFLGFPPQKKGRKTFLEKLSKIEYTIILYESSHRILKLINELVDCLDESRRIFIAREISKIHEEFIRGTLTDCKFFLENKTVIKGEFVVILEGYHY